MKKFPFKMSESSDEDIPLSTLVKKSAAPASTEKPSSMPKPKSSASKKDDSSDDDVPLASLKANKQATSNNKSTTTKKTKKKESSDEDSSDDDSDDDVPLAKLKKDGSSSSGGVKRKVPMSSPSTTKKAVKKPRVEKGGSSVSEPKWTSLSFDDPLKPQLVNRVLCRWNYCGFIWPPKETADLQSKSKNFRKLEGFPGVFIGVKGSALGLIRDERSMLGRPCYSEVIKKSSSELRDLWVIGVRAQREDLIKHEGEHAPSLKLLEKELHIAEKLSSGALSSSDSAYLKSLTKKTR